MKNTNIENVKNDLAKLQGYIEVMQNIANGKSDQKWMYSACIEEITYWFDCLKDDVKGEME